MITPIVTEIDRLMKTISSAELATNRELKVRLMKLYQAIQHHKSYYLSKAVSALGNLKNSRGANRK